MLPSNTTTLHIYSSSSRNFHTLHTFTSLTFFILTKPRHFEIYTRRLFASCISKYFYLHLLCWTMLYDYWTLGFLHLHNNLKRRKQPWVRYFSGFLQHQYIMNDDEYCAITKLTLESCVIVNSHQFFHCSLQWQAEVNDVVKKTQPESNRGFYKSSNPFCYQ